MTPLTSEDAVQAIKAWLPTVAPELTDKVYDHVPGPKPLGLPDCVIEVTRTGIEETGSTRFRFWDIQQKWVYFVEVSLSFMVDNADTQDAAGYLRDLEHRLVLGVLQNPTLDNAVPFASPLTSFDFTAPFVEYEDGTKGREMSMTLAVGDLVEAQ